MWQVLDCVNDRASLLDPRAAVRTFADVRLEGAHAKADLLVDEQIDLFRE
jgi:hypothetical protein